MICSLKKFKADQLSSPPNWNSATSWKVLIDPEIYLSRNGSTVVPQRSTSQLRIQLHLLTKKDNAAAREREIGKFKKYEQAMALNPIPANLIFQPLAVETFGSWFDAAAQVLVRIGKSLARESGLDSSTAITRLSTAFGDPSDQKCRHDPKP
jgi:hypothetical protein